MGNKILFIPVVFAVALFSAAFLFSAAPVAAAERDTLARSIADMVTQRLCDRQAALGGRVTLIHPSKCTNTPPPTEPTVTLTASPTTISSGQSTTLTWTSTNATSCTAFEGWSGTKPTSGTASVSPTVTTTYQLDCTGPGGVGSDDATVTVTFVNPTMPTVDISASPATISSGSSTTLTWNSENATSCTASNGWSGAKAVDGSQVVSPSSTATYVLSCTGPGGTTEDSVTVNVNSISLQTITQIVVGDARFDTLETAVIAAELADDLGAAGPYTVFAPTDDAFAALPDGVLTALLAAPTTTLKNVLLYHVVSGAFDAGDVAAVETLTTLFERKTLNISVTAEGVKVNNALITVTDIQASNGIIHVINAVLIPPAEASQPTVDLVAAPNSVTPGTGTASTTLTWTTTNATSCSASGGTFTGSKALNGSETITPSATTTYMLECIGAGGTTTDSVTVNFVPTPVEPEPTVNHLLISEVYYDVGGTHGSESSAANANEWFELYNPTTAEVNLTNWWIQDTSTLDKIPDGTTIPAGGRIVITATSTTSAFWGNTPMIVLGSAIGGGLANGGDALSLINANGATTTVDALSWGTDTSVFASPVLVSGDDNSLARTTLMTDTDMAADWAILADPTPGL